MSEINRRMDYSHERHTEYVIEKILAERRRQKELGYTPEHDDTRDNEELADAAIAYAFGGTKLKTSDPLEPLEIKIDWLTDAEIRSKPRLRQLIIAAAFIVAEIERLERQVPKKLV